MLTITLLGTSGHHAPAPTAPHGGGGRNAEDTASCSTAARGPGLPPAGAVVNLMKMDAVCLTHYHGDHILGLQGLLQTLGCRGRTRPLALYGPKGLGEVWAALQVLTGPLPYPVYAEVLDAPAALCEKFGGWPPGREAHAGADPPSGHQSGLSARSAPGRAVLARTGAGIGRTGKAVEDAPAR